MDLNLPWTLIAWFLYRLTIFQNVIHVRFPKSNHSWMLPNILLTDSTTLRVGKSHGILKFIVTLWSHYHYKHCCYTVEIRLIFSSRRWKRSDRKPTWRVWFFNTLLSQLHVIIEVKKMWRKFGLSLSSHAVVNFFTYLKVHPNFEPFVLGVWFTWDLKC